MGAIIIILLNNTICFFGILEVLDSFGSFFSNEVLLFFAICFLFLGFGWLENTGLSS